MRLQRSYREFRMSPWKLVKVTVSCIVSVFNTLSPRPRFTTSTSSFYCLLSSFQVVLVSHAISYWLVLLVLAWPPCLGALPWLRVVGVVGCVSLHIYTYTFAPSLFTFTSFTSLFTCQPFFVNASKNWLLKEGLSEEKSWHQHGQIPSYCSHTNK